MTTAKSWAGILILLVHVIGGFIVGRVFVILFFASQSELSLNPEAYVPGPRRAPVTPIWFLSIAGVFAVLFFGPLLYLLGRRFPRVAAYSLLLLPMLYGLPFVLSVAVPGISAPDAVAKFAGDLAAITYYSVIGSLFGIALISAAARHQQAGISMKSDHASQKKKRVKRELQTGNYGTWDGE